VEKRRKWEGKSKCIREKVDWEKEKYLGGKFLWSKIIVILVGTKICFGGRKC
jgi:hypothetical protein